MPQFRCKCNYIFKLRTGVEDYYLKLVENKYIEYLVELIDDKKDDEIDKYLDDFFEKSVEVLKCPNCTRIYVTDEEGYLRTYVLDESF